jgi:hypothetical protein
MIWIIVPRACMTAKTPDGALLIEKERPIGADRKLAPPSPNDEATRLGLREGRERELKSDGRTGLVNDVPVHPELCMVAPYWPGLVTTPRRDS